MYDQRLLASVALTRNRLGDRGVVAPWRHRLQVKVMLTFPIMLNFDSTAFCFEGKLIFRRFINSSGLEAILPLRS